MRSGSSDERLTAGRSWLRSQQPGHRVELVAEAGEDPRPLVAVVGGDAVEAVLESLPRLGALASDRLGEDVGLALALLVVEPLLHRAVAVRVVPGKASDEGSGAQAERERAEAGHAELRGEHQQEDQGEPDDGEGDERRRVLQRVEDRGATFGLERGGFERLGHGRLKGSGSTIRVEGGGVLGAGAGEPEDRRAAWEGKVSRPVPAARCSRRAPPGRRASRRWAQR